MSSPVVPSDIKSLIPKPGGNFCEKFLNSVFNLPLKVWQVVSYIWNEDGSFTEDFKADVCNIECKCAGGATIPGGGLRAPVVSASDGQYSDRVALTWDLIPGAVSYDVYRNTINNSASANVIASDVTVGAYEDTTVTAGQYYYYWVKAKNPNSVSPFSASDRGHAGSIATTLPQITDLAASQGFGESPGKVSLVFTPVTGAETYDVYRNTTDDFATATLIDSNRSPFNNAESTSIGNQPFFVDNGGELVYLHDPGFPTINYYTPYYFWVVAKRSGPPIQSQPSNSARGWVKGRPGIAPHTTGALFSGQGSYTIPSGMVKIWFALHGSGAGGAGGNVSVGGGGGGGSPVVVGWINVVAGGKIRVVSTPEADTSNAAASTNGSNGPVTKFQYSANGLFSDTVDVATASAAAGGVFNGGGGGAGGASGTGSFHASVQDGVVFAGRDGKPAVGTKGGRSGTRFGNVRWPGAHFNSFAPGASFGGDGQTRGSGSGSYASPTNAALAIAGKGQRGFAVWSQYTS